MFKPLHGQNGTSECAVSQTHFSLHTPASEIASVGNAFLLLSRKTTTAFSQTVLGLLSFFASWAVPIILALISYVDSKIFT